MQAIGAVMTGGTMRVKEEEKFESTVKKMSDGHISKLISAFHLLFQCI
jgi:hypothetical protein